ncbi:MAG: hypothetical protein HYU75_19505 [Betaproteobacteria bacterium]|nr:hypothetical protein [Betaproteobacteria bacterium]
MSAVLKSGSVRERLAAMGYETNDTGMPPAEFGAFFKADLAYWTKGVGKLDLRKTQLKDPGASPK